MKIISKLISLTLITLSLQAIACDKDGRGGIVPENDLYIPMEMSSLLGGISEDDFHGIISKVESVYVPIVKAQGNTLNIVREWQNAKVNAYASRKNGFFNVHAIGGLARHQTTTPDGFALVLCHEIGHHIAGAPLKESSWASNEGQSDYFATTKCLRKLWKDDDNLEAIYGHYIPTHIKQSCEDSFKEINDIAICQRTAMAGVSVSNLFRALSKQDKELTYAIKDPTVVVQTKHTHPAAQCRLDTYIAGATCTASKDIGFSKTDLTQGACTRENNNTVGVRPLCWYQPKPAPPKQYDELSFVNLCDKELYFAIRFQDPTGLWRTEGWAKLPPQAGAHYINTNNKVYYYYAQDREGSFSIQGLNPFVLNGATFNFKRETIMTSTWGTWTQYLSCN